MARAVTYHNPPNAPKLQGLYSHVAIAEPGRLAFIAGQVATDKAGNLVGAGDIAAQVTQVFANLEAILKDLGATFADVLALTTYVVGAESVEPWIKARAAAYERIFPGKAYPPNTFLVIDRLFRPEFLVEISAVARVP